MILRHLTEHFLSNVRSGLGTDKDSAFLLILDLHMLHIFNLLKKFLRACRLASNDQFNLLRARHLFKKILRGIAGNQLAFGNNKYVITDRTDLRQDVGT